MADDPMTDNTLDSIANSELASNNPSPVPQSSTTPDPLKLPPCDQCRRRKVKCDGKKIPCDRCVQSQLACTREIARKKRGPKKGSGSVIAKLRDEHEHGIVQESGLPPFDFSQLDLKSTIRAPLSTDSPSSSPLGSPLSPQFGDLLTPSNDPPHVPRSIPTTLQNGSAVSVAPPSTIIQGDMQLPLSWQLHGSDLLQFQAPLSPTGYVTVSDLAQQIFHENVPSFESPIAIRQMQTSPSHSPTPSTRPNAIGALLTSTGPHSPSNTATTAASSPLPPHGPNFLYRTESGTLHTDGPLGSLASEVGMSAYLMSQCVKQYWRHLYPIMPILHEPTVTYRMSQKEEFSNDEKVLFLSICAITVLHAAPQSDLSEEKKMQLGKRFVDLSISLRKNIDWMETASLTAIQSSYHIAISMFEMKKPRSHHFYLQEAIGMAHEQGLHLESTYAGMSELQAICSRRTFALLFITERGLAILRNKRTLITRLPYLPSEYFDDHDRVVLAGFSALVSLFSVLDEKFVYLWSSNPGEESSAEPLDNIAAIQHGLNNLEFDNTSLTDIQKADVLITHQWLRLIFWQAAMRQGLISSTSADPIFFYNYPIVIAKDLCYAMNLLTFEAILVHGLGIFEKLFEVAYTLMDALTIAKMNWADSDELRYLFRCLSASPNSQNTYVKMLEIKMDTGRSPVQSPNGQNG